MLAVDVTGAALHTRDVHDLAPGATVLAGQGLVAAALLGSGVKGEERVALQWQLTQPHAAFYGEVDGGGAVRARMSPAALRVARLDALSGMQLVIKSVGVREVYRGVTRIERESVEHALAGHLHSSDQVETLLRIGALEPTGAGRAAGVLVQRMPGADEDGAPFSARYGFLADGPAAAWVDEVRAGTLGGHALDVLEERTVVWRCGCTRQRVEAMLAGLAPEELRAMLEEDDGAEVSCHFCTETYTFDGAALQGLLAD